MYDNVNGKGNVFNRTGHAYWYTNEYTGNNAARILGSWAYPNSANGGVYTNTYHPTRFGFSIRCATDRHSIPSGYRTWQKRSTSTVANVRIESSSAI